MAAIPIANDQPGVASRLEWLGVAEVVDLSKLNATRLRAALMKILQDPRYREKAQARAAELRKINGVRLAADLVEKAFNTREVVLRNQS
jgi:UDP:flavonoid glycosyltransferase YjiC (YdhE family)